MTFEELLKPTRTGSVTRILYDKAFGFVRSESEEFFFHLNDLLRRDLFERLEVGDTVAFCVEPPKPGTSLPRAVAVQVIE